MMIINAFLLLFFASLAEGSSGTLKKPQSHGYLFIKKCQKFSPENRRIILAMRKITRSKHCKAIYGRIKNHLSINLANSGITSIRLLEHFPQIRHLNLEGNSLRKISIPASLSKLTKINLSKNNLTALKIPQSVRKIRSLNLNNNLLTSVPDLNFLSELSNLNLGNNSLSSITGLGNHIYLLSLNLSNNKISFGTSLHRLTHLVYLNMSRNRIGNINFIKNMTHLITLDLSHNQIENINPLSKLISLRHLNLSGNQISDIRILSFNRKIEFLNLSENRIKNIRVLSLMKKITHLNLNNNFVFDTRPLYNQKIRYLDLSENRIQFTRGIRSEGSNLEYLNLRNNPLRNVDRERKKYRYIQALKTGNKPLVSKYKSLNLSNKTSKKKKKFATFNFSKQQHAIQTVMQDLVKKIRIMLVFAVISLVIVLISLWVIFDKVGIRGWYALVPGINLYYFLKICQKPVWWISAWIIPFLDNFMQPGYDLNNTESKPVWFMFLTLNLASLYIQGSSLSRLRQLFGKKWYYVPGMLLLPFIFFPLVARSRVQYTNMKSGTLAR